MVYGELRRLAASRMAREACGHTLQPTALVHEAWLRLGGERSVFDDQAHFFASAAEAMRRILVEKARRKLAIKRGAGAERVELAEDLALPASSPDERLLQIHEALDELAAENPELAEVVKLRFFAGMTNDEAAAAMDLNEKTVRRYWQQAKLWLFERINGAV